MEASVACAEDAKRIAALVPTALSFKNRRSRTHHHTGPYFMTNILAWRCPRSEVHHPSRCTRFSCTDHFHRNHRSCRLPCMLHHYSCPGFRQGLWLHRFDVQQLSSRTVGEQVGLHSLRQQWPALRSELLNERGIPPSSLADPFKGLRSPFFSISSLESRLSLLRGGMPSSFKDDTNNRTSHHGPDTNARRLQHLFYQRAPSTHSRRGRSSIGPVPVPAAGRPRSSHPSISQVSAARSR